MSPEALSRLFQPRSVVYIGGSNLKPTLRYHREQGFSGSTWIVNPKYQEIEGYPCLGSIEDLPEIPDLAFIAINRDATIQAVDALRRKGCGAVICNAAGFAEMGPEGAVLQQQLMTALGDMAMLGPNAFGLTNFLDPLASMMDHLGCGSVDRGIAIIGQGGGFLCDVVFADRSLELSHLVGCGNQVAVSVADCAAYLVEDPRVSVIGLSFEGLPDVSALRRAAWRASELGKPIVAMKFGRTEVGAQAALSHTASLAGSDEAWTALFERLNICVARTESEFLETLKFFHCVKANAGAKASAGRDVLVAAVSGVNAIMIADQLSEAGMSLPQPSEETAQKLKALLPDIATPGNPQDVTMAAWNQRERQADIIGTLLDEGYDTAILVQNYPRAGMWDVREYTAQMQALGDACRGRNTTGIVLAPMVDCFPSEARAATLAAGLIPMQGEVECMAALNHAASWAERRDRDRERGKSWDRIEPPHPKNSKPLDEVAGKFHLAANGVSVPDSLAIAPEEAASAAERLGFPLALKAVDARLLHKTEVGAVRIGLNSAGEVAEAVSTMRDQMAKTVPHIPLETVLVERMAEGMVCEVLAAIRRDPAVGPVLLIGGGGTEAEMWRDTVLLALPVSQEDIDHALDRLIVSKRLAGWRGKPAGDRGALVKTIAGIVSFYEAQESLLTEIEVNPIIVTQHGAIAVDAVVTMAARDV